MTQISFKSGMYNTCTVWFGVDPGIIPQISNSRQLHEDLVVEGACVRAGRQRVVGLPLAVAVPVSQTFLKIISEI